MDANEAREKAVDAIKAGRMEFRPGGEDAVLRMDLRKPDFTVTAARITRLGPNHVGVEWETASAGFGSTTFVRRGGEWVCDNEGMSRDFVKAVFARLVDDTPFFDEPPRPNPCPS